MNLHYIFITFFKEFAMGYEIDLHLFSKKLCSIMKKKKLTNKKGNPCPIALYNLLYPDDIITEVKLKENRQEATDKTRNIRNWINGKNYPKNISTILSLCNALEIDLNYLFTDMECKTHDVQFIYTKTGLSESNIERLANWKSNSNNQEQGYDWARNSIKALNGLLDCDNWFYHNVLNEIANYCYYRKEYENNENLDRHQRTEYLKNFHLAIYTANNGLRDCIERHIYPNSNKSPDTD